MILSKSSTKKYKKTQTKTTKKIIMLQVKDVCLNYRSRLDNFCESNLHSSISMDKYPSISDLTDVSKNNYRSDEFSGSLDKNTNFSKLSRLWCWHKSVDRIFTALDQVSLEVQGGEFIGIIGTNGSGKTSLLRAIAGLEKPHQGTITINGKKVFDHNYKVNVSTFNRKVGMVFHDLALFPHMRVKKNITYGLSSLDKQQRKLQMKIVSEIIEMLQIQQFLDKYCYQLSAGQKQRVAIARAIAPGPKLLLLDEPFAHLDRSISQKIIGQIKRLLKKLSITSIMVCHNQSHAFEFADKLVVMLDGKIRQFDFTKNVYQSPCDYQVADFIGGVSFIDGELMSDGCITAFGRINYHDLDDLRSDSANNSIRLGVRADGVDIVTEDQIKANKSLFSNALKFKILSQSFKGFYRTIKAQIFTGETITFRMSAQNSDQCNLNKCRICLKSAKYCIYER